MPNVMVALPNIGGAVCSTPQSLADAHYLYRKTYTPKILGTPLHWAAVAANKLCGVPGRAFRIRRSLQILFKQQNS